jgi:surfeit locus 1 family protein
VNGQAKPRRGRFVLFALLIAVMIGVLAALGTWQLERLAWKEGLIATLDTKLSAKATDLPPRERWAQLDAGAEEFRRVAFPAEFLTGEEALVYSSGSALRPDAIGPGYWVFSPARLTGGSLVVVNRGFVPDGKQNPDTRREGQRSGVTNIVGVMRWPEQRGQFTPKDEPEKNLWFDRDPASMAEAKHWGTIAPFYVDMEAPPANGGLPKVGPLKASLPNNHLQYAVTWYGLAAVTLIAALFFWHSRRRGSV